MGSLSFFVDRKNLKSKMPDGTLRPVGTGTVDVKI